jgi:hypothetical protein
MSEEVKKKKIVSFSQFTNWFTCSHKWYRDYILKEKQFEDSLNMSFGTAIHETIQHYLQVSFHVGVEEAKKIDTQAFFVDAFKKEVDKKKIPHTLPEFNEFVGDGENVLKEFLDPANLAMYFSRDKWELLAIEDELNIEIKNNVMLTGKLDIVLREKATGNIRIVDFKTSTNGWTSYQKEDFTKTSQLVLYKALYSKKNNIPLPKIFVEFIILKRKLYENSKFVQSRLQLFKPSSYQSDVLQVIQEFGKFVDSCFTPEGLHKTDIVYPKIPGKGKKNCKYCPYLKNKKCDGIADAVTL